jgi:hypothetical protein
MRPLEKTMTIEEQAVKVETLLAKTIAECGVMTKDNGNWTGFGFTETVETGIGLALQANQSVSTELVAKILNYHADLHKDVRTWDSMGRWTVLWRVVELVERAIDDKCLRDGKRRRYYPSTFTDDDR